MPRTVCCLVLSLSACGIDKSGIKPFIAALRAAPAATIVAVPAAITAKVDAVAAALAPATAPIVARPTEYTFRAAATITCGILYAPSCYQISVWYLNHPFLGQTNNAI